MLTTARCIGLLDRTGAVQAAAGFVEDEVDLVEFDRVQDLEDTAEQLDILVLGARETTAAGLRRITRFRAEQPAAIVVAHVDGDYDKVAFAAAGIRHVARGKLSTRKLATAVVNADEALRQLAVAADHLIVEVEEEPDDEAFEDEFDDYEDDVEDGVGDDLDAELEELTGEAEPAAQLARLVTVASATGGCGKTFYATNLAGILAARGARVLVVDLDLQFGEVAAALQVRHPFSLYDGLFGANGARLAKSEFAAQLDTLVAHHKLGFDVLTAPKDPQLAENIRARHVDTVLDAALPRYDVVIADTPPSLNDTMIAALSRSDSVLCLASLDVPSMRNLNAFLDVLRRLKLDDKRIELLMNKADSDVGVTVAQAQESFQNRFTAVIPYDRTVSRSINLGTTVVAHAPRSKVTKALVAHADGLGNRLLAGRAITRPEPVAAPQRRSALSALFARVRTGGTS